MSSFNKAYIPLIGATKKLKVSRYKSILNESNTK
jgi:hypothetical protein